MNQKISIKLSRENLSIDEAKKFVSSPNCGAISIFIGTTRINENDSTNCHVHSLYYEAYDQMALNMMNKIVMDILSEQNDDDQSNIKVYVRHKIGHVPLGETSIIIAVSSPHRLAGHRMVMEILNKIKQTVPIWKKIQFDSKDINDGKWSDKSEAFWLQQS
ncbi:Molybdopterin synthase catalytic subunit [Dermatophagoides pteronyssinus]|uniref:Molybdopterin synthase catalytic subunit n=1 Tax=Dermatophagoides pteronyssinus TaxID=6956 RepID=A0ABQ8J5T4_DERPT|nr:Molybdopterin synthase catalytic subunit [Dermatophagoides pteronyssinus]